MSKLQEVLDTMEIYQQTYPEDACVIVFDTEKLIAYLPGKTIDLKIKVGDPVSKFAGTATTECMRLVKTVQQEQDASRLGVSYVSTATPIKEGGNVIGALIVAMSTKRLDTIRSSTSELSATVEEMTATTEQVANASNEVSSHLQELSTQSQNMIEDIKQIDSVLNFVQDVASQSNLLGLNAAIEAARAGEHGRGFEVVANEIRKMAANSKDAAGKIKDQLLHIQQAVKAMDGSIQQIAAFTEEHSASMQELNSAFAHIAKTAEKLSLQ